MGKKIATNPKAAAARQREIQKREEENERIQKQIEDAKWIDDDKHVNRKLERKNEKEKKRQEDLNRKRQNKLLAEEEIRNIPGKEHINENIKKTRKEIEDNKHIIGPIGSTDGVIRDSSIKPSKQKNSSIGGESSRTISLSIEEVSDSSEIFDDIPENINRAIDNTVHAKGVDAAIDLLQKVNIGDTNIQVDRHPEKRKHAAFKAYEEREMERLKIEYPNMTFSQRQQYIFKMWQKSPENPLLKFS